MRKCAAVALVILASPLFAVASAVIALWVLGRTVAEVWRE